VNEAAQTEKELINAKRMRRKFYTILRDNTKSLAIVPEGTRMIALQPAGERPPFFIVDSFPYFIDVVQLTGADQPILSLIGYEDTQDNSYTIADEADAHIKRILERQPRGPYMLGGCSASGIVAYEIAQQLRARGHEVGLLVLFETPNPYFMREYSDFWMSITSYREDLSNLRWSQIPGWALGKLRGLKNGKPKWLTWTSNGTNRTRSLMDQLMPSAIRIEAARMYRPSPYSGRVLLVKRDRHLVGRYRDPNFGWGRVVQNEIEICRVNSVDHIEIFKPEPDRVLVAQTLRRSMDGVVGRSFSCLSSGWTDQQRR
jgi:thioesterase domain-containing protein